MSSPGASARGAVSKFGQGVGVGVAKRKSRKLLQYQYVCAEPPKADMDQHRCDVRFVPKADILRCGRDCYSITSSAPANRRKGRYRADWRNDHSYLTLHQIGRHFPKPAIFTMRPAEFDRDILALSVAGLSKARGVTLAKPGAIGRIEYAGYAGIAVSVAGLWWVVLGGYSGPRADKSCRQHGRACTAQRQRHLDRDQLALLQTVAGLRHRGRRGNGGALSVADTVCRNGGILARQLWRRRYTAAIYAAFGGDHCVHCLAALCLPAWYRPHDAAHRPSHSRAGTRLRLRYGAVRRPPALFVANARLHSGLFGLDYRQQYRARLGR